SGRRMWHEDVEQAVAPTRRPCQERFAAFGDVDSRLPGAGGQLEGVGDEVGHEPMIADAVAPRATYRRHLPSRRQPTSSSTGRKASGRSPTGRWSTAWKAHPNAVAAPSARRSSPTISKFSGGRPSW